MHLPSAFLQLPLRFDAAALAAELAAVPESAWRPHPEGHPGNAALPLVARHGDAQDDGVAGPMRPTPVLASLPRLRQAIAALDTVVGRSRLMRLDGNAEAKAHCDVNSYWQDRHRVHIPLLTTPGVRFDCGSASVHMAAGECWVFDTTLRHNVFNPEPTRRIHLVVDTVGSAALATLLAAARDPARPSPDFSARAVAFDTAVPALRFEQHNQPDVMTPWQFESRLDAALLRLAAHDASLVPAFAATWATARAQWRGLWAEHADVPDARVHYARVRDAITQALAPLRGRAVVEGVDMVDWVSHTALRPALGPAPGDAAARASSAPTASAPSVQPPVSPSVHRAGPARVQRPVFIISPPRSGSTLLFETLAQAPGLATIGGESHALIESIPSLAPAAHGFASNVLSAHDATPDVVDRLHANFLAAARDRDGGAITPALRLLEKTPKNALRVRFLAAAFPDAQFVYLYRDPRETLASMIDAWTSGRFVTYRDLPGWPGPPWSLLLTPAWRDMAGRDVAEIVARQWAATVEQALDDLASVAPGRWCLARYDALLTDPDAEIRRLCGFLGLDWDRTLTAPLPLARHALSSPDPDKWRRHADALQPVRPYFEPAASRLLALFADPPAIAPTQRRAPTQTASDVERAPRANAATAADDANAFRSVFSPGFPELLHRLGVSLAVSTYQSGRLILVRADGDTLNAHLRFFARPMGLALGRDGLALGTAHHVHRFRNQPAVAARLEPEGRHDACFLPSEAHVTGDIRVHELAFDADDTLWVVNTRFSCLCTLDAQHSFVPRWRPRFVSALAAEDRCHLNGLAMDDGRVRLVTALGATDSAQGWREHKFEGGVLLDVASSERIASGLAMPHSPRVHRGAIWVLESARGLLCRVDPDSGKRETVAELPGFTRGLAFVGPYVFVGLSQVREKLFDGLPLAQRLATRECGIRVVDLRSGATVALLRFEGRVEEIFDVQVLPYRYPDVAEIESDALADAFVLPDAALADVASAR